MGQKVNPNILRLGVSKNWDSVFFEKKNKELQRFSFRNIDLKNYIKRFFNSKNLLIHECKINYNDSLINIYVSYQILSDFFFTKKRYPNKIKQKEGLVIKKRKENKKKNLVLLLKKNKLRLLLKKNVKNQVDNENFSQTITENNNLKRNYLNMTINSMIKGLSLLTKNKFKFKLTLKCLNKNLFLTKIQEQILKEKLVMLQKFRNAEFFNDSVNVLHFAVSNNNSSELISKLISEKLKKIKRHKFFLSFLKRALTLLINTQISKVGGLKIIVKGRLNGAPRAKHKIITVGNVPTQTLSTKIDYSESNCHNSNGSYGIKVWVIPKLK